MTSLQNVHVIVTTSGRLSLSASNLGLTVQFWLSIALRRSRGPMKNATLESLLSIRSVGLSDRVGAKTALYTGGGAPSAIFFGLIADRSFPSAYGSPGVKPPPPSRVSNLAFGTKCFIAAYTGLVNASDPSSVFRTGD